MKVRWENNEVTSEPLKVIAADDPVTLAQYALDNDLLNTDGWRRFRGIAKNQKKMKRMINQAKLRSYRHAPKYIFDLRYPGIIPMNYILISTIETTDGRILHNFSFPSCVTTISLKIKERLLLYLMTTRKFKQISCLTSRMMKDTSHYCCRRKSD